jgi:hypothetical protein
VRIECSVVGARVVRPASLASCTAFFASTRSSVALVPHHADAFELSEMMRVAQPVDNVVAAIGLPAVVHGDALHLRDHPEVVHRDLSAALVAVEQGEERARGGVHPVQLAGDLLMRWQTRSKLT